MPHVPTAISMHHDACFDARNLHYGAIYTAFAWHHTAILDSLRRAAEALNCELAYVLIPRAPMDAFVEKRRRLVAKQLNATVCTHMALEGQDNRDSRLDRMNARAHDPSLHDHHAPKSMPKATTCKKLADTEHYLTDLPDSNVHALKAKCDAEKKAAAKAAAEKKSG